MKPTIFKNPNFDNYIRKNNLSYLFSYDESELLFNGNTEEEANHNLEMITFSQKQLKNIQESDLIDFFKKIIEIRKSIILNNHISDTYFYLWHDELAGNLRFSCIEGKNFPFGCRLNLLSSMDNIISSYKKNPGGFILKSELKITNCEEKEIEEDTNNYTLDLYTEKLS
jgi:hypothetical protein